jgi:hypothetical protein
MGALVHSIQNQGMTALDKSDVDRTSSVSDNFEAKI